MDEAWKEYIEQKGKDFWKSIPSIEKMEIAKAFFYSFEKNESLYNETYSKLMKVNAENELLKDYIESKSELTFKEWKEKLGIKVK